MGTGGNYLNSLLNRLFLLALSCCSLLLIPFDVSFIFMLFVAISISCLNYFLEKSTFRIVSVVLFAVVSCFFPYGFCFFPLLAYDILSVKSIFAFLPYLLAFILRREALDLAPWLFLLVGLGSTILLYYHTSLYETLEEQFKKSRDDSTELQTLLKEKNLSLIQKQDAEIYAATLKERNRIAREIHDNVGHLLSRSILMTGALKATNRDEALASNIQVLEETLTLAMDSIRDSVHDLHDRSVDLHGTLLQLIQDFWQYNITLDYDIQSGIPANIKYTYIAIIKEGLSNIIKHSDATKVMLVLREHPSLYQLILHDNGTVVLGHPHRTAPTDDKFSGIGLINIRERVEALNGNIQITNDNGFRIFITIPRQEGKDANTNY